MELPHNEVASTFPGGGLEIIDGAGHLIHHDAPVELAVTLRRRLAANSG